METEITDEDLWSRFRGHQLDHDNAAHYRGRLEHQLLINRCDSCGLWHQPPKPICPTCHSGQVTATAVSGNGTIFMMVLLHQGPPAEGVDYSTPHPVVTVELDEQPGLRFSSTLVGSANDEIRIGRRVELDWITRDGSPMPVFKLSDGVAS